MQPNDFTELAGRIEAVTRVMLHMAVELEERGIIDGPQFSAGLRESLRPSPVASGHLFVARDRLQELAGNLDAARATRRSRATPGEIHKGFG
ncbi:hypothetical protein [Halothiobacillus diazotrophicus]|uniref:hypothetical protein n=1 Tax=Halothiobacillus diazotrophicus TaxID=1860122 RepID=UPI0012E891E0|nr:hypothetical protein [Halothiobacillus diazotrophicus]